MLNHPGLYIRIKKYISWIKKTVKGGNCSKPKPKSRFRNASVGLQTKFGNASVGLQSKIGNASVKMQTKRKCSKKCKKKRKCRTKFCNPKWIEINKIQ